MTHEELLHEAKVFVAVRIIATKTVVPEYRIVAHLAPMGTAAEILAVMSDLENDPSINVWRPE